MGSAEESGVPSQSFCADSANQEVVDRLSCSGNRAAEDGDMHEAEALFARAAILEPRNEKRAALLESQAQCLMQLEEYTRACEICFEAVALSPSWGDARLTLARACLNDGRFEDAIVHFEFAAKLQVTDSEMQSLGADLARAKTLLLRQDERELIVGDVTLRLQQWRRPGSPDEMCVHGACGVHARPVAADARPSAQRARDFLTEAASRGPLPSTAEGPDAIGDRHGTGTMIWECGIVLAKYLQIHPALVPTGLRVLELGSGTGICGLVAGALGAEVLLTDLPPVLELLRVNCALNRAAVERAGGSLTEAVLDWDAGSLPRGATDADLILAADVLFQPSGEQLRALCALLPRLLAPSASRPRAARLLLAHKQRHDALDQQLLPYFREAGVVLQEVPLAEHHADYCSPLIKIFSGHWADDRASPELVTR